MKDRHLTISEHGMIVSAILIILALLLSCNGCTSARTQYYAGQGLDLATTYYALEVDGRFEEGNDLLGTVEGVIVGKAVYIIFTESMAYLFPKQADTFYKVGSVIGYGAGGYNIYQMGTH